MLFWNNCRIKFNATFHQIYNYNTIFKMLQLHHNLSLFFFAITSSPTFWQVDFTPVIISWVVGVRPHKLCISHGKIENVTSTKIKRLGTLHNYKSSETLR